MTDWVLSGLLLSGWVLAFYLGYLIGKARGWQKSADHVEALETLLADLKAREPAAIDPKTQPHEHTFTYGAQRRDHEWDFRVCQICGMENARKAGGH